MKTIVDDIYVIRPLVYNFNLCCTDVMAPNTDKRLTRDLIFDAVPNSSASILLTREIWSLGGIIKDIILVPFLKAKFADWNCR